MLHGTIGFPPFYHNLTRLATPYTEFQNFSSPGLRQRGRENTGQMG